MPVRFLASDKKSWNNTKHPTRNKANTVSMIAIDHGGNFPSSLSNPRGAVIAALYLKMVQTVQWPVVRTADSATMLTSRKENGTFMNKEEYSNYSDSNFIEKKDFTDAIRRLKIFMSDPAHNPADISDLAVSLHSRFTHTRRHKNKCIVDVVTSVDQGEDVMFEINTERRSIPAVLTLTYIMCGPDYYDSCILRLCTHTAHKIDNVISETETLQMFEAAAGHKKGCTAS
jgi:hypothetical protein